MKNPIRKQHEVEGTQDKFSKKAGLEFDPAEDTTRQEFKNETDTGEILRRMGMGGMVPQTAPTFGEWDADVDLQAALIAVQHAKVAHSRMPEELRKKYPTWEALLRGIERGEISVEGVTPKEEGNAVEASGEPVVRSGNNPGGPDGQSGSAKP